MTTDPKPCAWCHEIPRVHSGYVMHKCKMQIAVMLKLESWNIQQDAMIAEQHKLFAAGSYLALYADVEGAELDVTVQERFVAYHNGERVKAEARK